MIQPLWELEKDGEETGNFFLWRCRTGSDIWGSLAGAGLGCVGGATVAVELKSQDPSLPPP